MPAAWDEEGVLELRAVFTGMVWACWIWDPPLRGTQLWWSKLLWRGLVNPLSVFLFPLASKLRPPLSREENQNLLSVCCQAVVSYPSEEQMKKGNRIARAALNTQVLTGHSFSTSGSGAHLSTPWQCTGVLQNLSSPFLLLASAQEGHARSWPSHRNPSGDTGELCLL